MKNIFRFLMAVAVLFTASCAKEDISSSIAGGEVEVTFTANLPELGTRAYGDGAKANFLHVNVYDAANDQLLPELCREVDATGTRTFTFQLVLLKGMEYDIVLWADVKGNSFYTLTGKDVTVAYGTAANDDNRDAFYAYIDSFNPTSDEPAFTLYRPFAQLNAAVVASDIEAAKQSGVTLTTSALKTKAYTALNLENNAATNEVEVTFTEAAIPTEKWNNADEYKHLSMNYLLVPSAGHVAKVEFTFKGKRADNSEVKFTGTTYDNVPFKQNYRTNILGSLLTKPTDFTVTIDAEFGGETGEIDGQTFIKVKTIEEFNEAFADNKYDLIILEDNIVLNSVVTRASDPIYTVAKGKELTIDLNGKKLSSTSTQIGTNYNMFDVRGTLTVKNGALETKHEGENMNWNNSTNIFNVTDGGVLNLEDITAKNLGGSDMAFVAHLNNWGEVTLNVENSTLESTYVPVRVFNSGNDMNNVTIKNSTLQGVSAAFWVHNYTAADFGGSEEKAEAHKALLNLNIYNQGNTFSPDVNGIRYGFTNSVRADAYGITKSVSEDGTEVTLGSIVEDGLVRRGVAGTEENNTIKKVVVSEGVTTLYDRTFRRFYALETVELPSTLTTIGVAGTGVFQSCTALKNIVIPESVTVLGKGTFQECSSLESINIPAGVTRIEDNTFNASGLESIEFHAGVTYFGAQAFRDCKQLKKVTINAPVFTIEPNAFGVMAGALPGTVIYVANAEMKAYLENTLAYKNQFTIVAPEAVSNAEQLTEALANGENVTLTQDIETEAATTAPYGNKYGFKLDGGVLDGNGHELKVECYGDHYGIMTSGGTIKNLTIKEGCRAVMIMYPQQDIILDNVKIGGDGVLYPINTGEGGADGVDLIVTNSVIAGWTSYGLIASASFTNVEFKQGTYYNNIYGRVLKPYVNTTLTNCSFVKSMNLDLSALNSGHKITIKDCTVDGQVITVDTFTIPTSDAQYDTELFTVDLPSWATSINDCIVFE